MMRYDCYDIVLRRNHEDKALMEAYEKDVTKKIDDKVHEEWIENMEGESSPERYRGFKRPRGTIEHIYDK